MDGHEQIQATSDALYAAWNAHDADAVAACYVENPEIVDMTSGIVSRGRETVRDIAADRLSSFSDFRLERVSLLIDGSVAAERWIMRGVHTGEYDGLPPSGHRVEVCGATFSEFAPDGRVLRDAHYVNVVGLLHQLGVE